MVNLTNDPPSEISYVIPRLAPEFHNTSHIAFQCLFAQHKHSSKHLFTLEVAQSLAPARRPHLSLL